MGIKGWERELCVGICLYFWGFGFVFVVEEFGESFSFNGMNIVREVRVDLEGVGERWGFKETKV